MALGMLSMPSIFFLMEFKFRQNPEFASNFEKMFPLILLRQPSMVAIGYISRFNATFNFIKSVQIISLPFPFFAITIGLHNSVGPHASRCCYHVICYLYQVVRLYSYKLYVKIMIILS